MMNYFAVFLKGIAMGAADVVPGVSGGTIAFITGIYTTLLQSITRVRPSLLGLLKEQGVAARLEAHQWEFSAGAGQRYPDVHSFSGQTDPLSAGGGP